MSHLLKKDHLFNLEVVIIFYHKNISTAGSLCAKISITIPDNAMNSGVQITCKECFDFLTEHIINLNTYICRLWNIVPYNCTWVEWIRIILVNIEISRNNIPGFLNTGSTNQFNFEIIEIKSANHS